MANPTIFISYNRKDGAIARRIGAAFRDAGFAISAVRSSTTDADALKQELVRKINGADCVVALISPNSIASKRCRAETGYAAKRGKPIIAALVEGNEVPAQFREAHYPLTDASDHDIRDFVAHVKDRLQLDEEDEEEFEDLLGSLEEEEVDPGDRLMPSADDLRQYQREATPAPALPPTPRRRSQAGSLWVAPGGGPSNFVLTLVFAALILVVAVVVVINLPDEGPTVDIPNNWNRYETSAISIAVPPNWGRITDDDLQDVGGPFGGGGFDPEMFGVGELEDMTIEIVLVDPDPDAGAAFVVMSATTPDDMSLSELAEMESDFAEGAEDFGFGAGEIGMVDLPVGETLRVGITMEFMPGAGLEMVFYMNEKGDRLYMAMWMAGTGEAGPEDSVLDTIMQSYRIK
jgi:nucleoside 2-deoxyribosyltransferase